MIQIIKPGTEDLTQLMELWNLQYEYHHKLDDEYYVTLSEVLNHKFENYLMRAIKNNKPNILVAKNNNKLLGFITFEVGTEKYFDTNIKKFGLVLELFVRGDEREKGIGTQLLDAAEKYFFARGLKYCKLQCSSLNHDAFKFYDSLKFINKQTFFYKKI